MRFDLTDLRLFVAVADAGSITHGASRVAMALPSASARIAGMESMLGSALLERGRRGVTATPAGLSLLHHARGILHQIEAMHGELGEFSLGLRGHVRLMAHTAAMTEALPDPLAGFLTDHPGIDIALEERESRDVVRAVIENRADIGVVSEAAGLEAGLSTLEFLPFHVDRLVLVVPETHALAVRRRVAFADVVDETFVGLRAGSALQGHLDGHAAALGRRLKLRVRMSGFEALCRLVGHGVGLAIMPESAARRYRRHTATVRVRLSDDWAMRHQVICFRAFATLPLPARRLVEHLSAPGR